MPNPQGPYEFGSPAWMAAVHGVWAAAIAIAARDMPTLTFSMSEAATDPPEHLGLGGAPSGWACFVREGALERFERVGASEAEFRITADYQILLGLCRYEVGEDPERKNVYDGMVRAAIETGKVRTEGQTGKLSTVFRELHDVIARLTI